ncbi:MAG: F0F1 ATP synthase subunit alpha [Rhodospirillaceae bacterium]|nr:F0F1 ATP synthase subunit alpha [Rhodospirillaceae bacterium]
MLEKTLAETFGAVDAAMEESRPDLSIDEVGTVTQVSAGVVHVRGLAGAGSEELVRLPGDLMGMVAGLDEHGLGIILLGDGTALSAGASVARTGRVVDVPVGDALLGRIVDALGRPLDDKGPVRATKRMPVERDAPAILDRAPVEVPLQTGIKAIDAIIPIGRGQRELIVGDRQTGKTAIAVDSIVNQHDTGVVSVYCAIGQRGTAVARVAAGLREQGAMDRCVIVVAEGDDAPGLQYVAPYAATAIAEHFVAEGRDVLIVYDDLTRHARAYRELSLLLRRPPGREAYPGDIFYIHSRLLERATHLRPELGGGSLTALPIIETQAQNISAFIPTNLISITDGQIYVSPDLFQKGVLPAVDIGRSVSRVGGKAQLSAYRSVAGTLRLSYAQFEELESFARFGTRLDPDTRKKLERGRRVREALKQPQYETIPVAEQIAILLAVTDGLFDDLPLERAREAEQAIRAAMRESHPDLAARIIKGEKLHDDDRTALLEMAERALSPLRGGTPNADSGDADD